MTLKRNLLILSIIALSTAILFFSCPAALPSAVIPDTDETTINDWNPAEIALADFEAKALESSTLVTKSASTNLTAGTIAEIKNKIRQYLKDTDVYTGKDLAAITKAIIAGVGEVVKTLDIASSDKKGLVIAAVDAALETVSRPEMSNLIAVDPQVTINIIQDAIVDAIASIGSLSPTEIDEINDDTAQIIDDANETLTWTVPNGLVTLTKDAVGRVTKETYKPSDAGSISITYEYPTSSTCKATIGVDALPDSMKATATFTYDTNGRLIGLAAHFIADADMPSFVQELIENGFISFAITYPSANSIEIHGTYQYNEETQDFPYYFVIDDIIKDASGNMSDFSIVVKQVNGSLISDLFSSPRISVTKVKETNPANIAPQHGFSRIAKLLLGNLFPEPEYSSTYVFDTGDDYSTSMTFDSEGFLQVLTSSTDYSSSSKIIPGNLSFEMQSTHLESTDSQTLLIKPTTSASDVSTIISFTDDYLGTITFSNDLLPISNVNDQPDYDYTSTTTYDAGLCTITTISSSSSESSYFNGVETITETRTTSGTSIDTYSSDGKLLNSTTDSVSDNNGIPNEHYTSIYLPGVSSTRNSYGYYNSGTSERLNSVNSTDYTTDQSTSIYYFYNGDDNNIVTSGSKSVSGNISDAQYTEQYEWSAGDVWTLRYTRSYQYEGSRTLYDDYVFATTRNISTLFSPSYSLSGSVRAVDINYTYLPDSDSYQWSSISGTLYADEAKSTITATYTVIWNEADQIATLTIRNSANVIIATDTQENYPSSFIWIN